MDEITEDFLDNDKYNSDQSSNIESIWDCDKSTCICKCHSSKCSKCSSLQPILLTNGCNDLTCECICHVCSDDCECCCHETVCFCDYECIDPKCLCECHNDESMESIECTENCGDCYNDFTIECVCECHKDEECDCEECDIHNCNCRSCKELAKFFVDDKDTEVEAFETSKCECVICKDVNKCVHTWDNWEPSTKTEEILKESINKSQESAIKFETARRYLQGLPYKDLNKPLD
jgi:hypothetical protein